MRGLQQFACILFRAAIVEHRAPCHQQVRSSFDDPPDRIVSNTAVYFNPIVKTQFFAKLPQSPDLVQRVRDYGIIVVQNPSHLMVLGQPGRPAFEKFQPLKSLLSAGIPVALGSDGPTNPYLNILFATTHANRPSEAITREQAVTAYTLTSAYAEFAEKEKGSLAIGKFADLAVLSQDIFTVSPRKLPNTRAVLTMVGGKIVLDTLGEGVSR